ncbi:MAG: exosortase system-associated protein, TIGR04073 family [Blastochloris sp.]|nr:exosortase system-associated protein, TIGR04073 family [Blastochloris sp.]
MKLLTILALIVVTTSFARADLTMPKKPNFYDQMGQGIANVVFAPAELFDSTFDQLINEGPTVSVTKGFVQGTSRMVMNMAVGVAEIVTSPFAQQINGFLKSPAYDSGQVNAYPPADLIDNWY